VDLADGQMALGGQVGHDVVHGQRPPAGRAALFVKRAETAGVDAHVGEVHVDVVDVVGVSAVFLQARFHGGRAQIVQRRGQRQDERFVGA
jgi:hypothetical protein